MQPPLVAPEELFRLVHLFDVLAAIVFAVSGSLVASRKGLDVMAFMWFGVITGVGGGTVRDLILGVPVFWVQNPVYVIACLTTAVLMHFVAPLVESRYRAFLWFDAFGLALVSIAGTVKASDVGAPAIVAIAMGAVTGCVGGIIRDTLGHVPSVLLGREVYVTTSVLGACTFVALNGLGVGKVPAMLAGFAVTFVVRGLAIRFGWSLPVFRESALRERWQTDGGRRAGGPAAPEPAGTRDDSVS
ncbi:MAG TPA: trimeric intracellular cation channel family protein [Vicinamibacterales bacterium]